MGGLTLSNVSGSLKRCQRNDRQINIAGRVRSNLQQPFSSEQKMTSPQRWRQARRRRWLEDVCLGGWGWSGGEARAEPDVPGCKDNAALRAASACLHSKMEKSQAAAAAAGGVHTHCSSIPHTATATPLLGDWTPSELRSMPRTTPVSRGVSTAFAWGPTAWCHGGFKVGRFRFAGDVNPALLAERWLWFGGICLSVLGCCSEDDEHHFKTEETPITGIASESVEQGWVECVCVVWCLYVGFG